MNERSAADETSGEPWYRDGLRFACTRCGRCCGGAPGYVWVTDAEIVRLARRLGVGEDDFRRRYTRKVRGRGVSLRDRPDDYQCVLYDPEVGCTVYEDRPRQCRTYPFWGPVVASPATWKNEAEQCPGIGMGPRHDPDLIQRLAQNDGLASRKKR